MSLPIVLIVPFAFRTMRPLVVAFVPIVTLVLVLSTALALAVRRAKRAADQHTECPGNARRRISLHPRRGAGCTPDPAWPADRLRRGVARRLWWRGAGALAQRLTASRVRARRPRERDVRADFLDAAASVSAPEGARLHAERNAALHGLLGAVCGVAGTRGAALLESAASAGCGLRRLSGDPARLVTARPAAGADAATHVAAPRLPARSHSQLAHRSAGRQLAPNRPHRHGGRPRPGPAHAERPRVGGFPAWPRAPTVRQKHRRSSGTDCRVTFHARPRSPLPAQRAALPPGNLATGRGCAARCGRRGPHRT